MVYNENMAKLITACPHIDRMFYAFGMCKYCWKRDYYRRKPEKHAAAKATYRKRYQRVKVKTLAAQRKHYAANRKQRCEQAYGYRLSTHYGLSLGEYQEMVKTQKGLCAVCHQLPGRKRLAVDHNHKTQQIRELLCSKCNRALGLLNENKQRVLALAAYIQKWVHNNDDRPAVNSPDGRYSDV